MPEMPEVQGLVDFLRGRATGLSITRVTVAAFAALKTYDPPVEALQRGEGRHRDARDRKTRRPPDMASSSTSRRRPR
jgi:formamidopyrimidine-DNA glycosylase